MPITKLDDKLWFKNGSSYTYTWHLNPLILYEVSEWYFICFLGYTLTCKFCINTFNEICILLLQPNRPLYMITFYIYFSCESLSFTYMFQPPCNIYFISPLPLKHCSEEYQIKVYITCAMCISETNCGKPLCVIVDWFLL